MFDYLDVFHKTCCHSWPLLFLLVRFIIAPAMALAFEQCGLFLRARLEPALLRIVLSNDIK